MRRIYPSSLLAVLFLVFLLATAASVYAVNEPPPAGCSSRGNVCMANSQCCSNSCGSFSGACYDSTLSGGAGSSCYDSSECASNSCQGPMGPSSPGTCLAPAGGQPQQQVICPVGAICIENPLTANTFEQLLNSIIGFIFGIGITIAPVIFIIAGFLFVTSAGDTKKLETAKHMMLYAIIGLAVLLLARGLVAVLKSIIGVQ